MTQSRQVMEAKRNNQRNLVYLKAEGMYLGAGKGFEVGFEDGPCLVSNVQRILYNPFMP